MRKNNELNKARTKRAARRPKSSTTPPAKPGRPSAFTPELGAEICRRLADGESLRKVCADAAMPDRAAVRRWLARSDQADAPAEYLEFRSQYARAKEDHADALADEALDEARKTNERNAKGKKVLIDTLFRIAACRAPKVYGSKVDLTHNTPPEDPIAALMRSVSNRGCLPPCAEPRG